MPMFPGVRQLLADIGTQNSPTLLPQGGINSVGQLILQSSPRDQTKGSVQLLAQQHRVTKLLAFLLPRSILLSSPSPKSALSINQLQIIPNLLSGECLLPLRGIKKRV